MSFEGMDVGVMRRVSQGLQTQGQVLDHLISSIESTVGHAQQVWQGQDLTAFAHSWQSSLRTRLLAASSSLHELATTASTNADQQDGASGDGHSAAGSAQRTLVPGYINGAVVAGGASRILYSMKELSADKFSTGRYPKLWKSFAQKFGDPDLLRYKKSPILHALLAQHRLLKVAGGIGDAVSLAGDGAATFYDFRAGDTTNGIFDGSDSVADGVSSVPTPVSKLSGLAIHVWTDAARQAQQIDPGFAGETFKYMGEHPDVVVQEFGKATAREAGKLVGWAL